MTTPLHHHDQNPTRTLGNTPPDYLVQAEEERDLAYQVIDGLCEIDTDHNEAWVAMLERAKIEALALEVKCGELYEQWQKSLPCTHPEHMHVVEWRGEAKYTDGEVIDNTYCIVVCSICGKEIENEN